MQWQLLLPLPFVLPRGPVVANPSTQPAAAQDGTNGTAKRQKTPHLEHFASHYGLKERSTVYDDAVDMAYEPPKELASLDPAALTKPGGREAARHALEDIRQRYESLKASAAATEHLMSEVTLRTANGGRVWGANPGPSLLAGLCGVYAVQCVWLHGAT